MSDRASLKICSHHVGGRSRTRNLPIIDGFEADVVSVFYEPDTTSIDGIHRATAHLASQTKVLTDCLSGDGGVRPFYIFNDRYRSSILPLIPDFAKRHAFDPQFGWDTDPQSTEVVEQLELETRTLDQVLTREGDHLPPPDYLSIDTQGTELEIMQGGAGALERHVLAVFVEVGFAPTYEGQPMFSALEAYLREQGFRLASLEVFEAQARTRDRIPIGFRGRGFADSGEALFLRDPDGGLQGMADPELGLAKLAVIAFMHGYPHLTYAIVNQLGAKGIGRLLERKGATPAYLKFLREFEAESRNLPQVYPLLYSDILGPEHSAARFSDPDLLTKLDPMQRLIRYYQGFTPNQLNERLASMSAPTFIGIEALAVRYGMTEAAEAIREARLTQLAKTKAWLGLAQA
ncbi:MAG: FkbM family methyltransferase [Proteobacteria bacterium]|nr:FkbM family methyltransferase [Pseudomonadota bacterium]